MSASKTGNGQEKKKSKPQKSTGAKKATGSRTKRTKAVETEKLAAPTTGKRKPRESPEGATKTEQVLALLKQPNGATLEDLIAATGWQAHSVRGFLSGALRKKLGLNVASAKREDGSRVYTID